MKRPLYYSTWLFTLYLTVTCLGNDFAIVINEVNFQPPKSAAEGEFIELYNSGPERVDLSNWYFEAGIDYTFPSGTYLEPQGFLVTAENPAALKEKHGLEKVLGPWKAGKLANSGERIILTRGDESRIDFVHYQDKDPWPERPGGYGSTLELTDPNLNNEFGRSWHASSIPGGSPGQPNTTPFPVENCPVRINEIAFGPSPWVEIYNPNTDSFNLDGFVVARGPELKDKEVFPAGSLVQEFFVLPLNFEVSRDNTVFFLLAPESGAIVDVFNARFPSGSASSGRFPDGYGTSFSFREATPGNPNPGQQHGDIYLSEIMYHPVETGTPRSEPFGLEYVGISNRGTKSKDLTGWSLKEAVRFRFPEGTVIEPGGELLAAGDSAELIDAYPELEEKVAGSFDGRLANSSERILLRDTWGNIVDQVEYADDGPWPGPELKDGAGHLAEDPYLPGIADGRGASLCLLTSRPVENNCAQAWEAVQGGTPGLPPRDQLIPPLVMNVRHDPPVPLPGETVLVTCRTSSCGPAVSVELKYEIDGQAGSHTVPMYDDGQGPDIEAGDMRRAASIGPFPDGTIIAFHIVAEHQEPPGKQREVPGPGLDYLFAVDDSKPPANGSRSYRVVMREATWQELTHRGDQSNILLDSTFIGDQGEIRYNCGIRYRGATTRTYTPHNFRLDIPDANRYHGLKHLNLNRFNTASQIISMDLFRRAGLPYAQEWMVNLWIGGKEHPGWDDKYLRVEDINDDFVERFFGEERGEGKLYRGWEVDRLHQSADFSYLGENPDEYRPFYENMEGDWEHDDYEEIIALCRAFSPAHTTEAEFPQEIEKLIDVREWALFFAAHACISNDEGNLAKDKGDDYFVYFRGGDGKAVLIPWDFDDSFDSSSERLFRPAVDSIRRFLTHPAVAPRYYGALEKLMDRPFSRLESRQSIRLIKDIYGPGTLDSIQTFNARRMGYLYENVPGTITGGIGPGSENAFVKAGDRWRYFRGTEEPPGGGLEWTHLDYDDSGWNQGASGFGYGDGDDRTVLPDMRGEYTTVYIRRKFMVTEPETVGSLSLRIDYDDGFAAYLNGVELERENVPSGDPEYTWQAQSHEAGEPEDFDVSGFTGNLRRGENILAVIGVNRSFDSSDFSLAPQLVFKTVSAASGGSGKRLFSAGPAVTLRGVAPASRTRYVQVQGKDASWDPLWAKWSADLRLEPGENEFTVKALNPAKELIAETQFRIHRVEAFTYLSGTLQKDTTLQAAESPYMITGGPLLVPEGVTLSIGPGVTVLAKPGTSIVVEGTIQALGTEPAPIFFNSANHEEPWEGIGMRDTGLGEENLHYFRNCTFTSGTRMEGFTGFLSPHNARLLVENCRFENMRSDAINGSGSEVRVVDTRFQDIYEGIDCENSHVSAVDCTFQEITGDNDAIDFDGEGAANSTVQGCVFKNGMDDGVDIQNCSAWIVNNRFYALGDKAISCSGNGDLGSVRLNGNIIAGSGTAVALKDGCLLQEASHNTIVGNQEGISLFAKNSQNGAQGVVESCILWHNTSPVLTDQNSSLTLSYSDVQGEKLFPGAGNINSGPFFAGEAERDFHLLPSSPCIGTGKGGTDMGAVPYEGTPPVDFLRGDANADGFLDLSDAIFILLYMFDAGVNSSCPDACDVNDNGQVAIADPVYLVNYLYASGPEPPGPFPEPGPDPSEDDLDCSL